MATSSRKATSLFDWKYCECGCHSVRFDTGEMGFASLTRPANYFKPGSPACLELSENGCRGFLSDYNKRFATSKSRDEYILKKLCEAQLELRRTIDRARRRQHAAR
jgi:hypothetical protein